MASARLWLECLPWRLEANSFTLDIRLRIRGSVKQQSLAVDNTRKVCLADFALLDHASLCDGPSKKNEGFATAALKYSHISAKPRKHFSWHSSKTSLNLAITSEAQMVGFSRFTTRSTFSQCYGDEESNGKVRASADEELPDIRETDLVEETLTVSRPVEGNFFPGNGYGSTVRCLFQPTSIHPTSVVHPDAIIGEGVIIGPFCSIGPGVKLGNGCVVYPSSHIFGNTELGERCIVHTGAVVGADIPGNTVIGNENSIGSYAVVGVKCQDMKYTEGDACFLYIGHNNDIREYASIHRSSKSTEQTVIGNENLIMGSCHVAHDCKLGNRNILANGTLLGGHVNMKDFVHTGGAVAVHQFCHIDSYSFLAGGSMVCRDVPMFMMVAGDRAELRGLNLEGLRRTGFSDEEVRSIRRAYQKLFMNTDPEAGGLEERLAQLESNEELVKVSAVVHMLKSVRDCFGENRRGICNFRHWTSV